MSVYKECHDGDQLTVLENVMSIVGERLFLHSNDFPLSVEYGFIIIDNSCVYPQNSYFAKSHEVPIWWSLKMFNLIAQHLCFWTINNAFSNAHCINY